MAQADQHTSKRTSRRSRQSGRGSQKTKPSPWLLLGEAYQPFRKYLEPDEAAQRLAALPVIKKRYLTSKRERILQNEEISLSFVYDPTTGADYLKIHDMEYFHPSQDEPVEFLGRVVDIQRELECLSSTTAAPPPPPAPQTAPDQQAKDTGSNLLKTGAAALPGSVSPKPVDTKTWVTAEAIQLKKDNKIPADARQHISHFAKLLAKRNKSLRPVGWKHIKNMLPEWGLWPVESIKIS
jgi:hypothetical protein